MIAYLGSKRTLLPLITEKVKAYSFMHDKSRIIDLFSGTSRVGNSLRGLGYYVQANDINTYAEVIGRCFIEATDTHLEQAKKVITELQNAPEIDGYFTETYCRRSRFFQEHNGRRIDGIRESIAALGLEPIVESIVLCSLLLACDRVTSTTGIQMAYLKGWSSRSYNRLELRIPDIHSKQIAGIVTRKDATEVRDDTDLVYADPPYNSHSYLGNYHIWESLVRWDKPEVYGIGCKRVDVKERKSVFNSKATFTASLETIVKNSSHTSKGLLLSFNNEGFLNREEIETILRRYTNRIEVTEIDYKRYVGAIIGGSNRLVEKVSEPTHLRNKEYLFSCLF